MMSEQPPADTGPLVASDQEPGPQSDARLLELAATPSADNADAGEKCWHLDTVTHHTGDGTPVEFCRDCCRYVSVDGSPINTPPPHSEQRTPIMADEREGRSALAMLADRIEAADGPSRNIDLHIMRWVENIGGDPENALPYTASLDHSWRLLPVKWQVRQMQMSAPCADCRKWQVQLYGGREGERRSTAFAATPALALAAAALRAKDTEHG